MKDQEAIWREELKAARIRFIKRVREACSMSSPTRRRALYQQWRADLGDDIARESAKYAEAVLAGRLKLEPLEKMVKD